MPKPKPPGWPKYMIPKPAKSGGVAYYWNAPTWAKDCPVKRCALGKDYGDAKKRCDDFLNPQFDAWLSGGEADTAADAAVVGTFDWVVNEYKAAPQYTEKPEKTRYDYDAALKLVSNHVLKDGRRFGQLALASITPGAADRLFVKLEQKADGSKRTRTAILAMRVAQRAWGVAWRSHPTKVPPINPFAKMDLQYSAKPTRPFGLQDLMRFVAKADEMEMASIGTAAMIAFFWLQRQEDILGRLTWVQHYRPAKNPNVALIYHNKTRELIEMPLYDEDGTVLWPELIQRLDAAPRRGSLIVTRDTPDRLRKAFLPWKQRHFLRRVDEIRKAAGVDSEIKFMGLRHGGNTEGADADLTDAQLRALSGHRSPSMPILYAKRTMRQRREGARKRLETRTKNARMSE
jgi:hypothetical protein